MLVGLDSVSFDDWLLALHVLSAFAMVAGITLFWVLIVAGWRTDAPADLLRMGPLSRVAGAAIGIGMGGTRVLLTAHQGRLGDPCSASPRETSSDRAFFRRADSRARRMPARRTRCICLG